MIGCHQGVGTRLPTGWADATTFVSLSERYAQWRTYDVVPQGLGVLNAVTRENRPLRLTGAELRRTRSGGVCATRRATRRCPTTSPRRWSAATAPTSASCSSATRSTSAPFTAEDEAVLVQLAQMASSTIERLEALRARARRARGGRAQPPRRCRCCRRRPRCSPRASTRRASRRRWSTCSCPSGRVRDGAPRRARRRSPRRPADAPTGRARARPSFFSTSRSTCRPAARRAAPCGPAGRSAARRRRPGAGAPPRATPRS